LPPAPRRRDGADQGPQRIPRHPAPAHRGRPHPALARPMTDLADLPSARPLRPGACLAWLAHGWRLFLRDPARWAVIALIFVLILAALGFVPLVGWAISLVGLPVLTAGLLMVADDAAAGRAVRIDGLFDGLRRDAARHVMLGICYLVGGLLAAFVAAAIGG